MFACSKEEKRKKVAIHFLASEFHIFRHYFISVAVISHFVNAFIKFHTQIAIHLLMHMEYLSTQCYCGKITRIFPMVNGAGTCDP